MTSPLAHLNEPESLQRPNHLVTGDLP
jgi:hypothetical protein